MARPRLKAAREFFSLVSQTDPNKYGKAYGLTSFFPILPGHTDELEAHLDGLDPEREPARAPAPAAHVAAARHPRPRLPGAAADPRDARQRLPDLHGQHRRRHRQLPARPRQRARAGRGRDLLPHRRLPRHGGLRRVRALGLRAQAQQRLPRLPVAVRDRPPHPRGAARPGGLRRAGLALRGAVRRRAPGRVPRADGGWRSERRSRLPARPPAPAAAPAPDRRRAGPQGPPGQPRPRLHLPGGRLRVRRHQRRRPRARLAARPARPRDHGRAVGRRRARDDPEPVVHLHGTGSARGRGVAAGDVPRGLPRGHGRARRRSSATWATARPSTGRPAWAPARRTSSSRSTPSTPRRWSASGPSWRRRSTMPSRSSTSSARRPCPRAATTSASRTASPSRR